MTGPYTLALFNLVYPRLIAALKGEPMKKTDFRMDPSKPADNTSHVVEPPTKVTEPTTWLGVPELYAEEQAEGVKNMALEALVPRACDVNQDCPCTPLTGCQNLPPERAFSVAERRTGPSGCGLEDCDMAVQAETQFSSSPDTTKSSIE